MFILKFVVAHFERKVSVGTEDTDGIGHFYLMRNMYKYKGTSMFSYLDVPKVEGHTML